MSLWWTWMVMRVSYLVLSTDSRSLVVMSIRVLSISRKYWLVLAIIRRSCLALDRASSESRVHMIWMPNNPTLKKNQYIFTNPGCLFILFTMQFKINSHIHVINNWVFLTLTYLSREGIEKVDKVKLWFLCGRGSLSNYRMKGTLGFFQEGIEPNLDIPFGQDRALQLYSLTFAWWYSQNAIIYLKTIAG